MILIGLGLIVFVLGGLALAVVIAGGHKEREFHNDRNEPYD